MCQTIDLGEGNFAIVCGVRKPAKCNFCKSRPHTRLCDFPVGGGATCDARICDECRKPGPNDLDYCPNHESGKASTGFPDTVKKLDAAGYKKISGRPCKLCGVWLEFWRTPAGKMAPLEVPKGEPDRRVSHFATCKHADKFRKPKQESLFE